MGSLSSLYRRLGGLVTTREMGNHLDHFEGAHLLSDTQIKQAVIRLGVRRHVKSASKTPPVHDRDQQTALGEGLVIVYRGSQGSFVAKENCLEHCDHKGNKTAPTRQLVNLNGGDGIEPHPDTIAKVPALGIFPPSHLANVDSAVMVIHKSLDAILDRLAG